MATFFALAAALLATPASGHAVHLLPGVADEETTIPSGGIVKFHRGRADVLFVLDRAGRWYRVGLNEGCLSTMPHIDTLAFQHPGASHRIDRFTRVQMRHASGTLPISCRIDSIRRSEAPPQINSKSPVTLD